MPRLIGRIEIVEKVSDQPIEQPWHVRIVRGEKTYTTEKLTRKVGAQRSVIGLAKMFGWTNPAFIVMDDGRSHLIDNGNQMTHEPIPVLYLREMTPAKPSTGRNENSAYADKRLL